MLALTMLPALTMLKALAMLLALALAVLALWVMILALPKETARSTSKKPRAA